MNRLVVCLAIITVMAWQQSINASEEQYQGLKISTDNTTHITYIVNKNLQTYLGIESEFDFNLSQEGKPVKGSIVFKNGVVRDMNPEELSLYFAEAGGPNAVWDYGKEHGRVTSFALANEKLPNESFGKTSRLITNDGKRYIGRLTKMADKADGYLLVVDGACCGPLPFNANTISEIQQMK